MLHAEVLAFLNNFVYEPRCKIICMCTTSNTRGFSMCTFVDSVKGGFCLFISGFCDVELADEAVQIGAADA